MTMSEVAIWSQIISSVAVFITLIFLIVQVKQNTNAIKANTRHTIITNDLQGISDGIEHPSIEHSMYKRDLTEYEKIQLEWWLIGLCRTREHQWFQYRDGSLDRRTWQANMSALGRNLSFTRTRGWWKLVSNDYFDKGFVNEVNRYLAQFPVIHDWVHPFDRIDTAS